MKTTIAKITILATFIIGLGTFIYAHSYKLPPAPQIQIEAETEPVVKFDLDKYETLRARLYDAALDLCILASDGAYVWEEGLDNETKFIITNYRVPSLEVLLKAIDTMDEFGGDLADSFDMDEDSPLYKFDTARREYDEYLNGLK